MKDGAQASCMPSLGKRERDVLRLLVDGKNHREIAIALYISKHTAREYIARIYAKLGVNRRSTCIRRAIELGLDK